MLTETYMIWDPIERALWAIVIFLLLLMMVVYLNKIRQYNDPEGRQLMIGFSIFSLGFAINRLFFF